MAALGLSAAVLAAAPLARSQAKGAAECFPSSPTRSQAVGGGPSAAPAPRRRCCAAAQRCTAAAAAASAAGPTSQDIAADVCILGAGIIGLCSTLALLRADPALSVVLVDRKVPCSGATGAGEPGRGAGLLNAAITAARV